ncbi:MAG: hypothetical protein H7Z13_14445 [Ferruginibacter sp.]|nr:hypothetical protein [Ferruginibacter sp.]
MEKVTNRLKIEISREEMEKMIKEVKETFAFEHLDQNKSFSSVDLWNIQRRKKSISSRRNYV